MNDTIQIMDSCKKARELVSSIGKSVRREYKEGNTHIVEENGKSMLNIGNLRIEGINKSMIDLKRILKEKEENIKKLLKNYIEVQK